MPEFGEWETHTAIRQSEGINPVGVPSKYRQVPTFPRALASANQWVVIQSFESYKADRFPYADVLARECAQHHIAEGRDGVQLGWDPGECPALVGSPAAARYQGGVSPQDPIPVGTSSYKQGPPLYLLPARYTCMLIEPIVSLRWLPAWMIAGLPRPGDASEVAGPVLNQIPGWADAVFAGLDPEVQVLRVDGEASLGVSVPQAHVANAMSVTAHSRADSLTITPYSELGATHLTVGATTGNSSTVITFPDMQPGDAHAFDLASSRVIANSDPGENEDNYALVDWVTDFVWDIRIRFQIPDVLDVCRWLQRDDGLGVTAASRARTGTSLQRGKRHRGYR